AMHRRHFLLAGAPAIQTEPRLTWRLASSFPNGLDTIYGAAEVLARRVEQLTEGRLRIRPYSAGELVPAFEVLTAVQNGTVQMGHAASYYFKGQDRKSTRLNSSHVKISYAVFCLKKKK